VEVRATRPDPISSTTLSVYGIDSTDPYSVWNMETILQRSKEFVSSISSYAVGRIKDKVKAGQLYQAKDAIYWWAMRFIPDFPAIFPQWNREMMALIQLTAVSEDLSVAFRPKNNLGDLELAMFFSTIRRETVGVDNWQQHFVAWILSYITAARPGSFTVGPGYKKGASLGLQTTKVRVEDETLRWQHCQWFYIGDSIGVRVRSHFTKGYRNPHSSSNRDGMFQRSYIDVCLLTRKVHESLPSSPQNQAGTNSTCLCYCSELHTSEDSSSIVSNNCCLEHLRSRPTQPLLPKRCLIPTSEFLPDILNTTSEAHNARRHSLLSPTYQRKATPTIAPDPYSFSPSPPTSGGNKTRSQREDGDGAGVSRP
jgi:hypothetical protein